MSYMREKYGLGYTFAFVPDMQLETKTYPATLTAQFTMLANRGAALGVQMVLNAGDLVDTLANDTEWDRASAAYDLLDAVNMPYLVSTGNHDYDADNNRAHTDFDQRFPTTRFTSKSWWNGGFCEAGHAENAYCFIGGILYIILEFGPRQAVVDWANAILTANASIPAVISTHSFLYRDGTTAGTGDTYEAHSYFTEDVHNGAELWTELVKLHNNIILVCCGHDIAGDAINGVVVKRADNSDGGSIVNQCLVNFQEIANGGNGYTRFYKIQPAARIIKAVTVSYDVGVKADAANQFAVAY